MAVAAYLYHGQWVGDCSRPGCAGCEHLMDPHSPGHAVSAANPRDRMKSAFHCSYCMQVDTIAWPPADFMEAALAVLMQRPFPHNRNWYPQDHPGAVRMGIADHGQTLDELRQENRDHDVPV